MRQRGSLTWLLHDMVYVTGLTCEEDEPCRHGGACAVGASSLVVCQCTASFTGYYCTGACVSQQGFIYVHVILFKVVYGKTWHGDRREWQRSGCER